MKLTKERLKQIIREEVGKTILTEEDSPSPALNIVDESGEPVGEFNIQRDDSGGVTASGWAMFRGTKYKFDLNSWKESGILKPVRTGPKQPQRGLGGSWWATDSEELP